MSTAATLHCTEPGCTTTTHVLPEHVVDLLAGGGWVCWQHADDELAEVPC